MSGHGDKLGRNGEQAHETEGAFRVGTHHDLVTALGLAVQLPSRSWRLLRW